MTGYEEKIYRALVQHGPLDAKALHRHSDVPKNRIYDCIVSLENKGFVETKPTIPKIYKATEPKIIFEKFKSELENEQKEFQQLFEKQKVQEKTNQVWIAQGRKAAIQARISVFRKCKKEYLAIVGKEPDVTTEELAMIAREHKNARGRKVKISILWNMKNPENIEKAERIAPFGTNIRHFPVEGFTFGICDRELIHLELPDKMFGRIIIWIRNKAFAEMLAKYFEKFWEDASDWKKFRK